eukprot:9597216-Karenia_brevis.AAC.1
MRSMLMKAPSLNQIGTSLSGKHSWVLTEDGMELFLKYDAEALGTIAWGITTTRMAFSSSYLNCHWIH